MQKSIEEVDPNQTADLDDQQGPKRRLQQVFQSQAEFTHSVADFLEHHRQRNQIFQRISRLHIDSLFQQQKLLRTRRAH